MNKYYFILIILFFSCTASNKLIRTRKNIELLKQLGYCNCLNYSINRFIKKDTVDISLDLIIDKMDFYGGYFIRSKNMYPLLDSAAMSISLKEEKYQFTNGRVEGAYGKVAYRLECIEFYKSKQLDSLAKTIARQINDSIYIDPFYKK